MTLFGATIPMVATIVRVKSATVSPPATIVKPSGLMVLALDPGTRETAFIIGDSRQKLPLHKGKWDNETILDCIANGRESFASAQSMVIEMVGHYGTGMAVGKEVFETCIWIGRFHEAWKRRMGSDPARLLRKTVCGHVCNSGRAKDKNIRQAIIDRYGGEVKKCKQCKGKGVRGRKSIPCDVCHGAVWKPGPLDGFSGDIWQAMAVFVTFVEGKFDVREK
jgi:hypothetical protein